MPEKQLNQTSGQEEEQAETEVIDTQNPEFLFEPDTLLGHEWKQQGPFLVCFSCELKHSLYIGIGRALVGFTQEGKPVIEKRFEDQ